MRLGICRFAHFPWLFDEKVFPAHFCRHPVASTGNDITFWVRASLSQGSTMASQIRACSLYCFFLECTLTVMPSHVGKESHSCQNNYFITVKHTHNGHTRNGAAVDHSSHPQTHAPSTHPSSTTTTHTKPHLLKAHACTDTLQYSTYSSFDIAYACNSFSDRQHNVSVENVCIVNLLKKCLSCI